MIHLFVSYAHLLKLSVEGIVDLVKLCFLDLFVINARLEFR